jgi:hypothetical protein
MSDQIIPQATWQPRWYYVMVNKTSGKKYVGQTVRESMVKYCGSGGYWKAHCKKHGGRDRQNIEVLEQVWIADKAQAQQWLDSFAAENGEYWLRENTIWANACKETVDDSPFAGFTDEQRKINAKAGGDVGGKIGGKISAKNNVESGEWKKRQIAGGKITGKNNVESGEWKRRCSNGGKTQGKIQGKKNVESGLWAKICVLGGKNGGKISGKNNVESGHLDRIRTKEASSAGGKSSGQTKRIMSHFCQIFGITSPGKNYVNIDKAAFQAWKESLTQVSEIG